MKRLLFFHLFPVIIINIIVHYACRNILRCAEAIIVICCSRNPYKRRIRDKIKKRTSNQYNNIISTIKTLSTPKYYLFMSYGKFQSSVGRQAGALGLSRPPPRDASMGIRDISTPGGGGRVGSRLGTRFCCCCCCCSTLVG